MARLPTAEKQRRARGIYEATGSVETAARETGLAKSTVRRILFPEPPRAIPAGPVYLPAKANGRLEPGWVKHKQPVRCAVCHRLFWVTTINAICRECIVGGPD